MLRTLALSLALLAVTAMCSAEITHSPATCLDISRTPLRAQPNLAGTNVPDEDSAAENELLEAANKNRELAGVLPLRMDETIREAARLHARRMVDSQQLEHQLFGESALLQRIAAVSPLKMDRVAENIAYASCAPAVNDVLMRSAPHRQNLLDGGFNVAGIAAVWSKGKLYVVQDFGHEVQSYSAKESEELVRRAVSQIRQQTGLPELIRFSPQNLDEATCRLSREDHPNAHLLATAYQNHKIITYTQSQPNDLPAGALPLLRDPRVQQFAVGSCYARNAAYPAGMYWVAILLQ